MSIRLLGALAALTLGAPAFAGLTTGEIACQKKAATQSRSFFKTVAKALEKCHDKVSKGTLPPLTDCSVEPTTAAKITSARTKLGAKVAPACPDPVVATLIFGADCYGAATTGAELATCLADAHQAQALALMATLYGDGGAVGSPQISCQKAVGNQGVGYAANRLGALQKCKLLLSKGDLPPQTNCLTESTTAAKIAAFETKAITKIQAKCPDPSVVALDFNSPCAGTSTGAGLTTCATGIDRDRVGRMIVTEFGQGPTGLTSLAKKITDTNDCVRGPLSRCRANDYLLENARIRVVVQDIQRNLFGIGQFGGQIIDADLNRGNPALERDNFEEWSTAINLENVAHYTNLTIINDGSDGQAAVLRATGVDDTLDFLNPSSTVAGLGFNLPASADDQDLPVEVATDYILEPDVNFVRVETTVTNIGATGYPIFLGEFLNGSGQVNLFQPVNGFGGPLVTAPCPTTAANPCNFVAYSGYKGGSGVSYAYVHEIPGTST